MCLVLASVGAEQLLKMIRDSSGITGFRLKLYQNDYVPLTTSVYSNFTEATFSGYSAASPDMSVITTGDGKATWSDSAQRNFVHNGGATSNIIYGYYVYWSTGTVLLWAERFPTPVGVAILNDSIRLTVKFSLGSC